MDLLGTIFLSFFFSLFHTQTRTLVILNTHSHTYFSISLKSVALASTSHTELFLFFCHRRQFDFADYATAGVKRRVSCAANWVGPKIKRRVKRYFFQSIARPCLRNSDPEFFAVRTRKKVVQWEMQKSTTWQPLSFGWQSAFVQRSPRTCSKRTMRIFPALVSANTLRFPRRRRRDVKTKLKHFTADLFFLASRVRRPHVKSLSSIAAGSRHCK